MSDAEVKEVLEDAISLCERIKDDHRLWRGDVGLNNNQREDVNDLLARYKALQKAGGVA